MNPKTARRLAAGVAAWRKVAELMRRVRLAYRHRKALILLARVDDRMLADIGLTRGDLRDAAALPKWKDPTALLYARAAEKRLSARPMAREAPMHAGSTLVPDGTAW
ncbi:MAG: DUF1127 domain-containing protein [Proteobacteria bacterium]|nr:DUF1127 domain-containing protein [Pseudomonadota bacterium]